MKDTYLIYAEDYSLIKRKIDDIVGVKKDIVRYDLSVDNISELLDDASCISLFGDKKVIIGENATFLTGTGSSINHDIEYLEKYINEKDHENIVIFSVLTDKLDERKRIVKQLKKNINIIKIDEIDEKHIDTFVISEFNKNGYKIDNRTANYFINYVGKNIDIILSEIKKMIVYKDQDKKISIEDINNISSKAYNDNVFDICDAIMKKNFQKTYECYQDLTKLKEEPIKIIALISNQFILVYQSKLLQNQGKSQKEISEILKVHPYRVKLALETNYSNYELEKVIKKLHELDYSIKSGKEDKTEGLKNFIFNL